ncbi:MAG: coenzyme F420-0:L-glutamate ligase [Actinomycetota bacterium]|nr:coenzyme F420-0:L-glutamate ligase [Actinomycetota bacterium]
MIQAYAVDGFGEVVEGTDLAQEISRLAEPRDGDIVLVTSKVVSKAEGQVRSGTREDALPSETVRVVARRGPTTIVENHLALVMAAGGVDASNVEPGHVVLLPRDPDATARGIREQLAEVGVNVAVVVTDTAGRPWRMGQTDIAIGAAGLDVLEDLAGSRDTYGNELAVTAPAIADELAGLAELVAGKLTGRPVSVVRGMSSRVLPGGQHGPGARALVRDRGSDMFALGTREAVLAAVQRTDGASFGTPATAAELVAVLAECGLDPSETAGEVVLTGSDDDRLRAEIVAFAYGWRPTEPPNRDSCSAEPRLVLNRPRGSAGT